MSIGVGGHSEQETLGELRDMPDGEQMVTPTMIPVKSFLRHVSLPKTRSVGFDARCLEVRPFRWPEWCRNPKADICSVISGMQV